ncbi:Cyclin-D1-1 [Dichanthelium oligosanthes]|uniref:Cyclin-D1-1 n=1 Tax=Dichanthelium oligosanthes TaxID=888268 RepID=A0A1E5UTF6_9POAL|nr:Cyclin-D1-1 [Dichanthelium oligosanthes]
MLEPEMPCCDDDALLLCGEDASELERDGGDSGRPWAADAAGFHEQLVPVAWDAACSPAVGRCPGRPRSDDGRQAGWAESVSWILKARLYHGFQPATAYLAVSYMDRFLSSSKLPDYGWAFQLLSVACLSLAAKMEETSVPPLLDLQVNFNRFYQCNPLIESTCSLFEPRTVRRMELFVLSELDWRLRSLTPFAFIDLFACKADSSGTCTRSLVLRACQITLNAIHEAEFLNPCPASMAAAAVLYAVTETPGMSCISISPETAASWCTGLTEEGIRNCYQLLQQLMPMTTSTRRKILASEMLRSMPSSVSSASPRKRRKINGGFGEE